MNKRTLLLLYVGLVLAGLSGATQWVGHRLGHPPALGPSLRIASVVVYPPWAIVRRTLRFGPRIPRRSRTKFVICLVFFEVPKVDLFGRHLRRRLRDCKESWRQMNCGLERTESEAARCFALAEGRAVFREG